MPTTCGDIQQKKCARGVGGNRKSTESTFGPRFSKPSNFPRAVQNTFGSEPFHFRVKKVFSHAHNDFHQSHLTPRITLPISPENQISKPASTLYVAVGQAFQPDVAHHQTPQPYTCRPSPENPLLRDEDVRLESLTYTRDLNTT
jgi:hypothetical protein